MTRFDEAWKKRWKGRYCSSCGERKPLRWPKDEPQACSMNCCARMFLLLIVDQGQGHCQACGTLESCHCYEEGEE